MTISIKRAPAVLDKDMQRVITQIYDDINDLIKSINQSSTSGSTEKEVGKVGDLKIAQMSDLSYRIEARTEEGWTQTIQKLDITPLTDSTSGTPNDTIPSTGGTGYEAINNAVASLARKINELINTNYGMKIKEKHDF